jgi:hypothetical protein
MSRFKQVRKYLLPTLLIAVLLVSVGAYTSYTIGSQPKPNPDVYVGLAFGGNTTQEAITLINRVKGYTNLFILDAGRNVLTQNETAVEEICNYAVANGLSVIINMGVKLRNDTSRSWFWQQPLNVTEQWKAMWGDKFLGMYYNDEPGGIQLDGNWSAWFRAYGQYYLQLRNSSKAASDLYQIYLKLLAFMDNGTKPSNYNAEANFFVQDVLEGDSGLNALKAAGVTTYTSDYALYWFDYLGGYNVIFTELGWNCSVAEEIALVKGAARLQDKQWGAIITWTYNSPPYLDSGDQIYNQMLTSYEAGAKYMVIFNYPYTNESNYGTMTNDQFIALQRFWNDIHQKEFPDLSSPIAALVLPQNYGWGMRDPNDTIWGFWPPDSKTIQVATAMSTLLSQYGVSLDIVYYDPQYPVANLGYQHVYYWNQTGI